MPGIFWTHPDIIASRAYELDTARYRMPRGSTNLRVSLGPRETPSDTPAAFMCAGSTTPGASGAPAARGR